MNFNMGFIFKLVEVLLWSTKQNEAHSPNLIRFTEHFNNISYWLVSVLEFENLIIVMIAGS